MTKVTSAKPCLGTMCWPRLAQVGYHRGAAPVSRMGVVRLGAPALYEEAGMDAGVTVVELPLGSPWWHRGGLDTLAALRPGLDQQSLDRVLGDGASEGLRYQGAVLGDLCRGVVGWRIMTTTAVGRCVYVDDLVVDADSRSAGIGNRLLDVVATEGAAIGAETLLLDSAVHRADAHRFYFRERMHIVAFHFARRL